MSRYKNDPREITSKFDCVCAETGKPIKKGEPCIYYPKNKSVYHPNSKQAQTYREWQADLVIGNDY